jgi:hypothetical protein
MCLAVRKVLFILFITSSAAIARLVWQGCRPAVGEVTVFHGSLSLSMIHFLEWHGVLCFQVSEPCRFHHHVKSLHMETKLSRAAV